MFQLLSDIIILSQAVKKSRKGIVMAIIYNIEDYRKKKPEEALEQRIIKAAFGLWESEEERINYFMSEQCEKDSEEWEKLYPIPEEYAE